MDQHQRELRHAAAQAFLESLDKLQETLNSADQPPEDPKPKPSPESANRSHAPNHTTRTLSPLPKRDRASSVAFDLAALEDAVADIERYMQSHPQSPEIQEEE
ncbi:MAG: hypothetical protein VKJ46_12810 [Leptolyngbyaceae bacterium]|nr:hypothetical protein [Leptolyngbyaceae bacterium]